MMIILFVFPLVNPVKDICLSELVGCVVPL